MRIARAKNLYRIGSPDLCLEDTIIYVMKQYGRKGI